MNAKSSQPAALADQVLNQYTPVVPCRETWSPAWSLSVFFLTSACCVLCSQISFLPKVPKDRGSNCATMLTQILLSVVILKIKTEELRNIEVEAAMSPRPLVTLAT